MRVALTCHTPTTALAMRISRMTNGSTKAVTVSSPSSNQASTCRRTDMGLGPQEEHTCDHKHHEDACEKCAFALKATLWVETNAVSTKASLMVFSLCLTEKGLMSEGDKEGNFRFVDAEGTTFHYAHTNDFTAAHKKYFVQKRLNSAIN